MVEHESEALRWVARQWERGIETDVILNVYGMWNLYRRYVLHRMTTKSAKNTVVKVLHCRCSWHIMGSF